MKTIIEMAREAGLVFNEEHGTDIAKSIHLGRVQAFAELVRADEREACAKECERMMMYPNARQESAAHDNVWAAAKAIRARGNT